MNLGNNLIILWFDIFESLPENKVIKSIDIYVPSRFKILLFFFLNTMFSIGHATRVLESDITTLVMFKRRGLHFRSALFSSTNKLETLAGTLLIVLYSLMTPNSSGVWYIVGSVLRLSVDL